MKLGDLLRGRSAGSAEESAGTQREDGRITWLPVDEIDPNPYQPRTGVDGDGLAELMRSIEEQGLLQPIVVRPAQGRYQVVAGERRLRACRALGWQRVPAVVRSASDPEMAEMALVENVQRAALSFFEEAAGYQRLMEEFGYTQEQVARRVGKSQPAVANKLRLLKLSPAVRAVVARGGLNERQARALLKLAGEGEQIAAAEEMARRRLSAEESEQLVEEWARRRGQQRGGVGNARPVVPLAGDLGVFRRSLRALLGRLERSGMVVACEEHEEGTGWEVRIRVTRPGQGSDAAPDRREPGACPGGRAG